MRTGSETTKTAQSSGIRSRLGNRQKMGMLHPAAVIAAAAAAAAAADDDDDDDDDDEKEILIMTMLMAA